MVRFPHAKINLGLSVVARREDGFHDIETIFYPVPLYDLLEINPAENLSLAISGLPVPGRKEDNLLIRAWQVLSAIRPDLPTVQIQLHKAIPMGAGLGGGSSDAAGLLLMLDSLYRLNLSTAELSRLAASLGSDCAFFLQDRACIGSGRGEKLEPVDLDLSAYDLLLVHPEIAVSTAWAYSQIKPAAPKVAMTTLLALPPGQWRGKMINDFEAPVFAAHPELESIREGLYADGALYASMTGSGSTFFGIFAPGSCPDDAVGKRYAHQLLAAGRSGRVW